MQHRRCALWMVIGHLHTAVKIICLKWLAAYAAWGQRWPLGLLLLTEHRWQVSHQSHEWFGSHTAHSTQSQHVCTFQSCMPPVGGPLRKTDHRKKSEKLNLQEVGWLWSFVRLRPERASLIWSRRLHRSLHCTALACKLSFRYAQTQKAFVGSFHESPQGRFLGGENRIIKPMM